MIQYNWNRLKFPHRTILSKNNISIDQLNIETQNNIAVFNKRYVQVMRTGISDKEKKDLLELSQGIADAIVKQFEQKQESSGSALGVLAVVGLLVGAAFGVNHFMQD